MLKVTGRFRVELNADRRICEVDVYKRQRKYPSIHPIDSWSKYQGVVDMARVEEARGILRRSSEINQMRCV